MPRRLALAAALLVASAGVARAAPFGAPTFDGDGQAIGGSIGIATGGRVTPGGARIEGHYLYQLNDTDWFDGTAAFTYGTGGAECFRDRANDLVCDHGLADGAGVDIMVTVRRYLGAQRAEGTVFRPFVRLGVGTGLAHFSDDSVTGIGFSLHGGGGISVRVAKGIYVVALGDAMLGVGGYNRGLGSEPLAGLAITAGVEFRL